MDFDVLSAGGLFLRQLSQEAPFVWRWSKIENGGSTEWRQVGDHFMAQPIYWANSSFSVKGEKSGQAESLLGRSRTIRSMVYCALCSITAAYAHFSRGAFTSRLVKRQLVTRPPCKNHECEGEAQDATREQHSPRCRNPNLRHTYQFGNRKSVES